MRAGDVVRLFNTIGVQPAEGLAVLLQTSGNEVWDVLAIFPDGTSPYFLAGVPREDTPNQYPVWTPRDDAGEYTPTLTPVDNVAGATALPAFFSCVGDVVTVHGAVNVQASSPGTPLTLRVSLPVPSALVTADHLAGVGSAPATTIRAHGTSDTAEIVVPEGPASSTLVTFSFAYAVR